MTWLDAIVYSSAIGGLAVNLWASHLQLKARRTWEALRDNAIVNRDLFYIASLAVDVHLRGKGDLHKFSLVKELQQFDRKLETIKAMASGEDAPL